MKKESETNFLRLFDIVEDIPEDPLVELKKTMKIEDKFLGRLFLIEPDGKLTYIE